MAHSDIDVVSKEYLGRQRLLRPNLMEATMLLELQKQGSPMRTPRNPKTTPRQIIGDLADAG